MKLLCVCLSKLVLISMVGGHELCNPMLVALATRQTGIVKLLRRMGAREVDPLESIWRKEFESGKYPKINHTIRYEDYPSMHNNPDGRLAGLFFNG